MNPVQLFFSLQGRVGRGTYWSIFGVWFLVSLLLRGAVTAATNWSGNEVVVALFYWASVAYSFGSYFPMSALLVKRLHDSGRSGWWLAFQHVFMVSLMLMLVAFTRMAGGSMLLLTLVMLVCGLGMLIVFIFSLLPSDGMNEHGFA
jgi:uncharacterized membrane protein YhaH (DUF805 family)